MERIGKQKLDKKAKKVKRLRGGIELSETHTINPDKTTDKILAWDMSR